MSIIESSNLTKEYGKTKALNNMSFTIEENKITGLIGRNGAGKTTLLKIIAGYIKKTSGQISVFDTDPFDNIKVASNMVFVDDKMRFPVALTLIDILNEVSKFYPNWDMKLAKGLFDYFEFNPNWYHGSLSKGMKSTFNMIIGLCSHSPITIFDEPTTGMDISIRKDFYRALLKDYIEFPRTILLSSHLVNEIDDLLEDILLIQNGKKCFHSSVDELKETAVCLKGRSDIIDMLTKDKKVLNKEMLATQIKCIALKKDFSDTELQSAILNGIELSQVTVDDLCIYLTSDSKGGIDNVFNRN
jgi:ABC-2 type transport system ATP-binding protein